MKPEFLMNEIQHSFTFPGGILIVCGADFLNVTKIKEVHNAIKTVMIAATTAAIND